MAGRYLHFLCDTRLSGDKEKSVITFSMKAFRSPRTHLQQLTSHVYQDHQSCCVLNSFVLSARSGVPLMLLNRVMP